MALAFANSVVISVDYDDNRRPIVQRHLRFQCKILKDVDMKKAPQISFSPDRAHGNNSTSELLPGDGNCVKPSTFSTSIGSKMLRTFPRTFSKYQWFSLTKEAQFCHLLGYQRQSLPHLGDVAKSEGAGLHAFALLGFQIAAAPNIPVIVNRTFTELHPLSQSSPPPLETTNPIADPLAGDTVDANKPEAATSLLSSPSLRIGVKNEPQSSPALQSWLHDINLDPSDILPGPFRLQQVATKQKKITEIFGCIDQLLDSLEILHFKEETDEYLQFENLGTGLLQNSSGSCDQGSSGKEKSSSTSKDTTTITHSKKQGANQGEKKRAREGGSGDGDESCPDKPPRKKTGPGKVKGSIVCIYYDNETNPEIKGKHKCKERSFATHQDLCRHILGVHIKPYQCRRCWERYGRPSEINRHTKEDTCHPHEALKAYVSEFSDKVLKSTEDDIYGILFPKGKKQYDLLDRTDELQSAPESDRSDTSKNHEIDKELVKSLVLKHAGNQISKNCSITSPKSPKTSIPSDRDEFMDQLERQYNLAERCGDAAVEIFMQQLIARFPSGARLALGYMLEKQKAAPPNQPAANDVSSGPSISTLVEDGKSHNLGNVNSEDCTSQNNNAHEPTGQTQSELQRIHDTLSRLGENYYQHYMSGNHNGSGPASDSAFVPSQSTGDCSFALEYKYPFNQPPLEDDHHETWVPDPLSEYQYEVARLLNQQ